MKKITLILAMLPMMLLADDTAAPLTQEEKSPSFSNRFSIGGNYTRVNLKPESEPSLDGNLGGISALYEYRPANAFYGAAEGKWRQGSSKGSDARRFLIIVDAAERLGYSWNKTNWVCTLYSGFAFRFLGHHLHPSSNAAPTFNGSFFPPFISQATSLKLDYYDFYFPVGLIFEYAFNSLFTLGLHTQWMAQAFSTVQIRPLGGTYWTLTNTFGNVLIEMPFRFSVGTCGHTSIEFTPFYELWHDGRSTAVSSSGVPLDLPKNTYNLYGANLNLLYAF